MSEINVITLTRFRADLARSLSRRADKLMEAPDLREQVQALEPLEAYFIVKEVGLESALPILRAATADQLQAFVDLDCWHGDQPDPVELDAWLSAFAADGMEALASAFTSLDQELQVWFLAETMHVYEAEGDDPVPEPARDARRFNTPDRLFVIDVKPGYEGELDPLVLVDALYRQDLEEAYKSLVAARWELASTLLEDAYRFRSGRVEDMGFPARGEALALFAPPPTQPRPPRITAHDAVQTLPALYAAPLLDRSLLSRALGAVGNEELVAQLERDFLQLVNLAVVAFGESPREVSHVADITTRVRDTLSVGLESLAGKDAADAELANLLSAWSLVDLYRQGYQQAVPLQKRAGTLARDPVVAAWLQKVETEADDYSEDKRDRAFVQGLLHVPLMLAGTDALKPTSSRAFASREDIAAGEARLTALERRIT
ncbi:MAG TPA: DUF6178 family protein [Myxococcota bacterium]|nr:DUF6178 family protein [Myxococcota bacterium]